MNNFEKNIINFFNKSDLKQIDKFIQCVNNVTLKEFQQQKENFSESITLRDKYYYEKEVQEICDWYKLFMPLINEYTTILEQKITNSSVINNNDAIIKSVYKYLMKEFVNISYRTVIFEINTLRKKHRLYGATKEDRYKYFTEKLLIDEKYINSFYSKYPVLKDIIRKKTQNTINYIIEIIDNVYKDINLIYKQELLNKEASSIEEISFNIGDTHANGKFVCILKFENNQKIIYKPRDMTLDIRLAQLCEFLKNEFDNKILMFIPKTLNIGNHGYVEFITKKDCENNKDLERYFESMGNMIALLYFLNSKDYHGENIIANGKKPFMVDNETLLHKNLHFEKYSCAELLMEKISCSVFSTGLLPFTMYSQINNAFMEVGALNSGKKRLSPYYTHDIINKKTDEIKIQHIKKEIDSIVSSPTLLNNNISCENYICNILTGFKKLYLTFANNKEKIINFIKGSFKDTNSRYIFRSTNVYTQILDTSFHPELLKDEKTRNVYLLKLAEYLDISKDTNMIFLKEEIKSLKNGDIPLFFVDTETNIVYNSNYKQILRFSDSNILSDIEKKIKNCSKQDMKQQIKFINMSFIGSKLDNKFPKNNINNIIPASYKKLDLKKIILNNGVNYNNELGWYSLNAVDSGYYNIAPISYNLYNGSIGIALAMSLDETPDSKVINSILEYCFKYMNISCNKINYGAFDGLMGIVYSLTCIYNNKKVKTNYNIGEKLELYLNEIKDNLKEVNSIDIINGKAGILGVCITVAKSFKNTNIEVLALDISKTIIKELLNDKKISNYNDIGYAHGIMGMLVQLTRYILNYPDSTYNNAILNVLEENITCINKQYNNNSFKIRKNAKYYSWCNGIAGIYLGLKFINDSGINISQLIDNTMLKNISTLIKERKDELDHSICHGLVGNSAILYTYDDITKTDYQKHITKEIFDYCNKKSYLDYDDWGLMTGFTGLYLASLDNGHKYIYNLLLLRGINHEN